MATTPTPATPGGARRPHLATPTAPAAAPAAGPAAAAATAAATPTAAAVPPPIPPPPAAPGRGPVATPPPPARSARNQNIGAGIILVLILVLAIMGIAWIIGKVSDSRPAVATPAPSTGGAPQLILPQGGVMPEMQPPAAVVGAFRPVSPDKRFLQLPNPAIANGNADGSTAVQWTDDVGIIYPRPPGPGHTKDSILNAAKKAGLEVLARENQNCSLDDYVLVDWPSNQPQLDSSGKQIVTGGVPQVVMFKVLKSPNITGIRHKNDPPTGSAGAMRPGSVESGQSMPNRPSGPPQGRPGMGKGPRQQSGSGGSVQTAGGNTSTCPSCGDKGINTPPRPFACRKCGEMIR